MPTRCAWVGNGDPHYEEYHDTEWGVPVHDDRRLFEMLILEGAQAGLTWKTILKKRDGYRRAFKGFDPCAVASLTDPELESLLLDPSIVRNRLKVYAARRNAGVFMAIQKEFESFDRFVWKFVGGRPVTNRPKSLKDIPLRTPQSDALSKELKRLGMTFVGSTIMYAYMQGVGMVNDHTEDCFRANSVEDCSDCL